MHKTKKAVCVVIAIALALSKGKTYSDAQRIYRKDTRSLRLKLRMKSVKRILLCNPLTRGLIMRSGIQSIRPYANGEK